ncbi:ISAs1 family transposase [Endozoicomonas sp. 8E]|uniref:ISAs1 family transposase n=1 Tax=Endozoicomonas sp. 8E TaxID=3035692 RepID=UPI002938F685|nr:ISAs1 family transposase [Endozoicomonas sp. 8E]WOG25494.1 ISAs1 family transposase [Endozoicomonas sp. 8E]
MPDPRQAAKCTHILGEVVFMTILGLLCGADNWDSIAQCAECKEDWLSKYLELPGGIPSHDTFNRIYALLDPEEFRDLFTGWVKDRLIDTPLSGVVAIDGKTVRSSRDKSSSAIHMVNAWSTEAGISLGQHKVESKPNEITAVPELLDRLAIESCTVTADAMSCQKSIASKILKARADSLLAVKNNQRKLYGELDRHFVSYWENNPTDSPESPRYSEQLDACCCVLITTCFFITRWL